MNSVQMCRSDVLPSVKLKDKQMKQMLNQSSILFVEDVYAQYLLIAIPLR